MACQQLVLVSFNPQQKLTFALVTKLYLVNNLRENPLEHQMTIPPKGNCDRKGIFRASCVPTKLARVLLNPRALEPTLPGHRHVYRRVAPQKIHSERARLA